MSDRVTVRDGWRSSGPRGLRGCRARVRVVADRCLCALRGCFVAGGWASPLPPWPSPSPAGPRGLPSHLLRCRHRWRSGTPPWSSSPFSAPGRLGSACRVVSASMADLPLLGFSPLHRRVLQGPLPPRRSGERLGFGNGGSTSVVPFRPRRFARPRRLSPPAGSRACCIPLPVLGFAAFLCPPTRS
jgi:hypothetical protein